MDYYTYGENEFAAILLSKIIAEKNDPKYARKVGRMWIGFTNGLKQIKDSNIQKNMKIRLMRVWTNEHISACRKCNVPNVIRSFLENIMSAKLKIEVDEIKRK